MSSIATSSYLDFSLAACQAGFLEAWNAGRIEVTLSASILAEYREAAAVLESKYRGSDFDAFAALLALNCEFVDAPDYLNEAVCADPGYDKFLACALASGIRLIVSGDEHLLEVSGWQGIEVIKPRAFCGSISVGSEGWGLITSGCTCHPASRGAGEPQRVGRRGNAARFSMLHHRRNR